MAESSTCLLRSFSQPSPTSSGEKKENPIQRALTSSVSFGRFMSESLDWEKWSAFTHNRYLEEVERYSRPGSVAEKKAYFEAHFKRRRAQALLEQQTALANALPKTNQTTNNVDSNASLDLESSKVDSHVATGNIIKDINGQNSRTITSGDPLTERMSGDSLPEEVEQVTELAMERPGDLTDCPMETDGSICDSLLEKEYNLSNEGDANMRSSAEPSEKEPEVSSSVSLANVSVSDNEPRVKPRLLKKDEKATHSVDNAKKQNNKRRSDATSSLHMSMINFASSCSGKVQKSTSSGRPNLADSRLARPRVKTYKSIMLPRISTEASENVRFKHPPATPPQENRTTIPHGDSSSRSRIMYGKVQSLATMSNSLKTPRSTIKAQTPTVPASFTFKSEERAAKRKEFFEKLELKFKSKEEEKQKPEEQNVKARNVCKDSYDSAASKSTETEGDHRVTEASKTKKIPTVRSFSPKLQERIAALKVHDNNSRPPWRLSGKTEGSKSSIPPLYYSTKLFSKRRDVCENASPNIQSNIDY